MAGRFARQGVSEVKLVHIVARVIPHGERERQRRNRRRHKAKLRNRVLDAYGRACACCGDTTPEFLELDHVNGGGRQHRKRETRDIYQVVADEGFPNDYRLLCSNCNHSLGVKGYCPHDRPAPTGVGAMIEWLTIDHKDQRYETCGDYWRKDTQANHWAFRTSKLPDEKYPWLIFLHELVEWAICCLTGVSLKAVDAWDRAYEQARPETGVKLGGDQCACTITPLSEPGDDPHAPYHDAHIAATQCERIVAYALGVDWDEYSKAVESL